MYFAESLAGTLDRGRRAYVCQGGEFGMSSKIRGDYLIPALSKFRYDI